MTIPVNDSSHLRGGVVDLVGRGGNRTPGERVPETSRGTIPHAQIHQGQRFNRTPVVALAFYFHYDTDNKKILIGFQRNSC